MEYKTLSEVLFHNRIHRDKGITFIEGTTGEKFCSYAELYDRSVNFLSYLQYFGIQPGNELVFQLRSNIDFIQIFWACILGGIIPVPLSPGNTDENKLKLFNVWKVLKNPYLITTTTEHNRIENFAAERNLALFNKIKPRTINLDDINENNNKGIIHTSQPNDIAYIQFSSGSTGDPKGVVLTHKNLLTNINSILHGLKPPPEGDIFHSWMPLTHDMGLIGFLLTPSVASVQQYIMPTELFIRHPLLWLQKASEHRITFTSSPNFGYRYVLKNFRADQFENVDLSSIRLIANGAEPISYDLCKEFTDTMVAYKLHKEAIFPVYGLAEASLAVTFSEPRKKIEVLYLNRNKLNFGDKVQFTKEDTQNPSFVNVGIPLINTNVRITDEKNNVVDEMCIGHIQIKGDNVTSGYYNNEDATKNIITDDNWLKTGDLGFFNKGCLFITGRAKDIIFVNGQNYYPHDLERIAEEIDGIELGKIVISGYFNDKEQQERIIAFILFKGKLEEFLPIAIKCKKIINQQIGFELHDIVPVSKIPKTTSGKVQRYMLVSQYKNGDFDNVSKQLQLLLQNKNQHSEEINGLDETDNDLLRICKEILENNNVSLHDNLFEIGGNSLNASQLSAHIYEKFKVGFPIEEIFSCKTIAKLSEKIKNTPKSTYYEFVAHDNKTELYSLSAQQKRLYYHWELNKESIAYNLPVIIEIKGEVNNANLEKSFKTIISNNEILRTSFGINNGTPYQKVSENIDFSIEEILCKDDEIDEKITGFIRPFNLNVLPLIRAALIKTNNRKLLVIDAHHIIIDGSSYVILVSKLYKLYTGNDYHLNKYQYKDYVIWQESIEQSEKNQKRKEYWLNEFKDEIPVLELPTDLPRPEYLNYKGRKVHFSINPELYKQIKKFAGNSNCSMQMVLLSAYYILLNKYTGQKDIIVGIPSATRSRKETLDMIGMFVNNLSVRVNINPGFKISEFINEIKQKIINALDNQDYMYGSLVSDLSPKSNINRNPLFDTMFVYQNMHIPEFSNDTFTWEQYFFDPGISRFDLTFEIFEKKNNLDLYIEYPSMLFNAETIDRIAFHYKNIINKIISDSEITLSKINTLSENEQKSLLFQYNSTFYEHKGVNICDIISEKAEKFPNKIAIIEGNKKITYNELNDKSNYLAQILIEKGIKADSFVGVMLEPAAEIIIAILGILKSGGAYLPIDIHYPKARQEYIINSSNISLIISSEILGNL